VRGFLNSLQGVEALQRKAGRYTHPCLHSAVLQCCSGFQSQSTGLALSVGQALAGGMVGWGYNRLGLGILVRRSGFVHV
jgi:hypothetical protein